ncbi:MAG: hypothetical protein DRI86_15020 [Bacteroidetes bacterium]|nr:MAG: hypothetical protein DRI86_15020 [Bacteroidota bacterium]
MQQLSFILVLVFFFNACVSSDTQVLEYTEANKLKYQHSTDITNFSLLTEKLLNDLCPTLNKLNKSTPLLVIDFTNIKELENHSELGFLLSEEIKTHTTQKCDWTINQIEFMRYLKIGANGTKLFSRDSQDIKYEEIKENGYALVGTYAFTQRQLILYLKIINLKTGVIIKSSTATTLLTDEIIWLEKKAENTKDNNYKTLVL